MADFKIEDCVGERVLIKGRTYHASVYEAEIMELSPNKEYFKALFKYPRGDTESWKNIEEYIIVEVLEKRIIEIKDVTDTLKPVKDELYELIEGCDQFDYIGVRPKMCFCIGPEKCGDSSCPIVKNHERWKKHDWINDPFPFGLMILSTL